MNRRGFLVLVTGCLAVTFKEPRLVNAVSGWWPAASTGTEAVQESWGLLRDVSALTAVSHDEVTGTWGGVRQMPGKHPHGLDFFGAPRRFV